MYVCPSSKCTVFRKCMLYAILRNYNKTESRREVDWGFPVCFESNSLCLNRPVMCQGISINRNHV